jgi:hypothetical protein
MDETSYRCFDDRCSSRTECRWWQRRHEGQGRVGMTWRHGCEDQNLPCAHFQRNGGGEGHCVRYEEGEG